MTRPLSFAAAALPFVSGGGKVRAGICASCELLMLTLTCKRAAALLSASMERGLPLRQRLLLRLHLRSCAACMRFKVQLRLLRSALRLKDRSTDTSAALPPDA